MLFAVLMLVVGVLVAGALAVLLVRRVDLDQSRVAIRLQSSEAHKVSYVVPEGQDPAILRAALARAGFESAMDIGARADRLLIACATPEDRGRVRDVIEHVDRAGFDGPEMHVSHVRFPEEESP